MNLQGSGDWEYEERFQRLMITDSNYDMPFSSIRTRSQTAAGHQRYEIRYEADVKVRNRPNVTETRICEFDYHTEAARQGVEEQGQNISYDIRASYKEPDAAGVLDGCFVVSLMERVSLRVYTPDVNALQVECSSCPWDPSLPAREQEPACKHILFFLDQLSQACIFEIGRPLRERSLRFDPLGNLIQIEDPTASGGRRKLLPFEAIVRLGSGDTRVDRAHNGAEILEHAMSVRRRTVDPVEVVHRRHQLIKQCFDELDAYVLRRHPHTTGEFARDLIIIEGAIYEAYAEIRGGDSDRLLEVIQDPIISTLLDLLEGVAVRSRNYPHLQPITDLFTLILRSGSGPIQQRFVLRILRDIPDSMPSPQQRDKITAIYHLVAAENSRLHAEPGQPAYDFQYMLADIWHASRR